MNKDFLIIANGPLLPNEIIHKIARNKTIIALDGAVNQLMHLHLKPDFILGDFDSISQLQKNYWGIQAGIDDINNDTAPYLGNHGVTVVPAKNQNYTDLMKAIHFCDENQAASISMVCVTGGRMDHHESATRSLLAYYKKERPILIYTETQILKFAQNERVIIKGRIGDSCGIMAFPDGVVTSQGLKYEMTNHHLKFAFTDSACNSLIQETAVVEVTGQVMIMMPFTVASCEV